MTGRILKAVLAAALAVSITIGAPLAAPAQAVTVTVTGPEETVYDYNTMRCDDFDIADGLAVAFHDASGRVQMISASSETRRMIGPDLNHLTRDCNPIFVSHHDPDPAHYDDVHWFGGTYTENGQDIYVLVHNEYHGFEHPGACQIGVVRKCHQGGITFAVSHDGGETYTTPAPPDNLVATIGPRYTNDFGRIGLYSPTAPIKKGNYWYSFTIIQQPNPQDTGVCAMRSPDITDPKSWRGWDGTSYSVRFRNPFYENTSPAVTHRCEPISRENILQIERSATFNTALGKYVMTGNSVKYDPSLSRYVYGFYLTTSDDLLHWSMRELLMEVPTVTTHVCGGPDPVAYPSLLDPTSTDRNFRTTGANPYLYYVRIHYDEFCQQTLDRDLVRIPIHIAP
jgi:hypothetical protein